MTNAAPPETAPDTAPDTAPETIPETIEVDSKVVQCDGGDDPLGHPRVYLNMGAAPEIDCPYCGRRFRIKAGATH